MPRCVGLRYQFVKIGQRAVGGVDVAEVGGGIAMVAIGIGGDGHQPDACDAQVFEIVQRLGDAFEVADAVAIAVFVRTDKDLHEGTVLPACGQRTGHHTGLHRADVYGGWLGNRVQGTAGQSNTHCAMRQTPENGTQKRSCVAKMAACLKPCM